MHSFLFSRGKPHLSQSRSESNSMISQSIHDLYWVPVQFRASFPSSFSNSAEFLFPGRLNVSSADKGRDSPSSWCAKPGADADVIIIAQTVCRCGTSALEHVPTWLMPQWCRCSHLHPRQQSPCIHLSHPLFCLMGSRPDGFTFANSAYQAHKCYRWFPCHSGLHI